MKLEFIEEVSEYGDQMVRLFGFDKAQAAQFRDAIQLTVIEGGRSLDLSSLDFIESTNCKLILHLAEEDEGIITQDHKLFFCDLTINGYKNMVRLIEPYCNKDSRSFQMLYELDTEIDFQFEPSGESKKE